MKFYEIQTVDYLGQKNNWRFHALLEASSNGAVDTSGEATRGLGRITVTINARSQKRTSKPPAKQATNTTEIFKSRRLRADSHLLRASKKQISQKKLMLAHQVELFVRYPLRVLRSALRSVSFVLR